MNAGQCKISVIVPVYKVEPYLCRCIDSILVQTHRNFELILVDDGSPDNCGTICDEYAERDSRIVVIHQENGGLSAARNAGIDWVFTNSDSQWLTFVDSDDCIRPQMLDHLYQAVSDSGALLSISKPHFFSDCPTVENTTFDNVEFQNMSGREICKLLYTTWNIDYVTVWGKLYHRDLFLQARFPIGKIHEDQNLIPRIVYSSNQVALVSNRYYCYLQCRSDSITYEDFSVRRFDEVDGVNACIRFYESQEDEELVRMAMEVRDRILHSCLLASWKRGLWREIPKEHRPGFWRGCKILVDGLYRKIKNGFR